MISIISIYILSNILYIIYIVNIILNYIFYLIHLVPDAPAVDDNPVISIHCDGQDMLAPLTPSSPSLFRSFRLLLEIFWLPHISFPVCQFINFCQGAFITPNIWN